MPTSLRDALLAVAALSVSGCAIGATTAHEVWSLDQGTDRIHIYDDEHNQVAAIDAVERSVDAVLLTGGGSHMAAVTPDDDAVWVAAIGAEQLVEIPLDLDADDPTFAIGRTISTEQLLADTGYDWPSYSPVCHDYDGDGRAWITMGPGIEQGGLFVLDTDIAEVVHAYDPGEIRANCGIGFTEDESRAIANWSGVFGADVDDQQPGLLVVDVETGEHLERLNPVEATDDEGNVINDVHGVGVRVTTGDEAVVGAAPAGVRPVAVAATSFTCHLPV